MTIFDTSRLLISLPAAEIATLDLPGSIMSSDQVLALPVSRALASALALLQSHCQKREIETRYLARPEIFTHGMPASWLRQRLTGFTNHLCLTDGSTVKHVDFCLTHIFLYRLAQYDSYASFLRLQRRAPELLQEIHSQLNTRFTWGEPGQRIQPAPLYLEAIDPPPAPPALAYPFQYRPYQHEETAQRVLAAKPLPGVAALARSRTVYVPFTETSLNDKAFIRAAARLIRDTFHQPNVSLLLRLPNDHPGATLVSRIACVLKGLAASGVVLPRNTPQNIFFVTTDIAPADAPHNLTLVLHESFEFWRHDRDFYEKATSIQVLASTETEADPEFLPPDVTTIFGPTAHRVWLEPPRRDDRT